MNVIKDLRCEYDLTQKQLSGLTGIPKRTIENWEGGKRAPKEWIVKLLAHYLKTTL